MNKLLTHGILSLALLVEACQKKEVTPDLTTPLTGQHLVDYLIVDPNNNYQIYTGGPGNNSLVHFTRKDNNTLIIDVQIQDAAIHINDRLQASVSEGNLANDGLLKPGLQARYKLSYTIHQKSTGVSEINLYKDGTIRGAVGYVNKDGYRISLGIMP